MNKFLYIFAVFLCLAPSFATAAVSLAQPNTSALSQGLVGYWPLDGATTNWATGTTRDLSASNDAGALFNISTSSTPVAGKIGQAFKFDGTNTYVQASHNGFVTNTSNFTFSGWVKLSAYYSGVNGGSIVGHRGSTFVDFVVTGTGNSCGAGKLQVLSSTVCGGTTLSLNKWYHVMAVVSGGTLRYYVNGVADGTDPSFSWSPDSNADWFIGAENGSKAYLFSGQIDEVRLYNKSLSYQEVALLYAAGTARIDRAPLPSTSTFNFGLNAGLVGYWPLDGSTTNWRTNTTSDISGSGNTGTLVAMSTSTSPVAGKIGQAVNFNGNTSYISTANNVGITGAAPRTISAWVKRTANCGSLSCPVVWWGAQTASQLSLIALTGNKFNFYGFSADVTGTATLSINTWYHVAATYDGALVRLYVNGVLDTGPTPKTLNTTNSTATIGYYSGWAAVFPGAIDDVRIYNRAFSAQEINQLYGVGAANIAHSNTTTGTGLNAGLVGYWTMDGGSINWRANTMADQSGSGNTGTLVLMSTTSSPVAGKTGQALKFNGTNQYVSAGNASAANFGPNQNFSIAFWMKTTASPASAKPFAKADVDSSGAGWGFYQSGAALFIKIADGSSSRYEISLTNMNDGKWHYVTYSINRSGNCNRYKDGVLVGTTGCSAWASVDLTNSLNLTLGANSSANGYWQGSLDDARIYNRALSTQEVQQLYLQGK